MTAPRGIGPLRAFPMQETFAMKWPQGLIDWMHEARYQTSANGLRVTESLYGETSDATPLVVWSYEMPPNAVMIVTTHIVGINSGATKVFSVRDTTCFRRAAGDVVYHIMNGATQAAREWFETDSATALTMAASGTTATVSVTGITAESWKWQGFCEYTVLRA